MTDDRAPESSSSSPVALPVIPRYRIDSDGWLTALADPTGAWVRAEDASRLESRIAALEAELLEAKAAKK